VIGATNRRTFLQLTAVSLAGQAASLTSFGRPTEVPSYFPLQDPTLVREMVIVAHGNLGRVKELLAAQPALARAAIDWGYGDWESALGAASHVGHRGIAELLFANGARPSLFSAAMLGQLDVVRAFVAASPGVQRTLGPHSITLLAHARAGGSSAEKVVDYLQQLGDADSLPATVPLDERTRDRCIGIYAFGAAPNDRLIVALNRDVLTVQRPGTAYRLLRYLGNMAFFPVGAEAVRIRFASAGVDSLAETVAVYDPGLIVAATRTTG
jgi:hypothetical protein